MRILLVEDDKDLSDRLETALNDAGFIVECVFDGQAALDYLFHTTVELVILDLGLPKVSGLSLLQQVRAKGIDTPVIILTARNAWAERVDGLNAGADDYIGKPFFAPEVVARAHALIRRSEGKGRPVLECDGLSLSPATAEAQYKGAALDLTGRELRILTYLMQRAGRIVSQAELTDHTYAWDETAESNTIEVYIGRLRRKTSKTLIKTIRGQGYRIG